VLKFSLEFTEAVFLGVALILQLDTPNVLLGKTKDHTRVLAQEVRNSWSDCWIVLKYSQEACFLGVRMKSPLDTGGVSSGQTRVPAQQVRNSWSDHCIVLKFLQEFQDACFLGVALKLLLDTHSVWAGKTKDHTRVPAQEVRNSWSDRWIVLKFLQEFQEACFLAVAMKSQWDTGSVSSGQTRVPAQEVHNSWSDCWIVLKYLHEFVEVVALVSQ